MKLQAFTSKGVKSEDVVLPKEFGIKVNLPLLAQAVYVYEERAHIGLRKTKTRSEVERTSKKLYKQKGTGGARHGSRRAPIFVGGGVALGPRPVRRILNLSNDTKTKAKFMAFALKAIDGQMIFVLGISKFAKTKEVEVLVRALKKATSAKRFTFVLSRESKDAVKAIRNLSNTNYVFYQDANALDIYRGGMIVIDKTIFEGQTKTEKKIIKKTIKKEIKKVVKE